MHSCDNKTTELIYSYGHKTSENHGLFLKILTGFKYSHTNKVLKMSLKHPLLLNTSSFQDKPYFI